jgi:hypothetical protein
MAERTRALAGGSRSFLPARSSVVGSRLQAEGAQLTNFIGGDEATLERTEPVLSRGQCDPLHRSAWHPCHREACNKRLPKWEPTRAWFREHDRRREVVAG